MKVLLLGGTAEARELARVMVAAGTDVVSSLAGRVSEPRLPEGAVRIGGFGGVSGLVAFLSEHDITHLVVATHPFATTMAAHASAAAGAVGIPVIRLLRPGWTTHQDAAGWHWVDSYPGAVAAADRLGSRPFITTGRQTLDHYRQVWHDREALVRIVEPLVMAPPPAWRVVHDRGPYSVNGEIELLRRHEVDVVLTKDSGGSYTAAKLDAARQLGVPVVVVRRPDPPSGMPQVADPAAVMAWLRESRPSAR